jgi:hypothetical protein
MTIGFEFTEEFIEKNHFTRVHDETTQDFVKGLVAVFRAVKEVWMVAMVSEAGKNTYEAFFNSIATFIKLTC